MKVFYQMRVGDTRKEFVVCCMDAGDAGKGDWHARLFFASAAKIRYTMYNRATQQVFPTDIKSGAGCRKHFGKTAGGRGTGLAFCDVGKMFRSL